MVSLGASGTLAQLYAKLTSDGAANAWPKFLAAAQGTSVTNDDPFGGMAQPAQLAHLAPWTVELAGKIFAAILADVAAGKAAHQIVASVRAAMVTGPAAKRIRAASRSHRLVPT